MERAAFHSVPSLASAYPSILLPLLLLGSIADKFLFSSHCMSELVGQRLPGATRRMEGRSQGSRAHPSITPSFLVTLDWSVGED